MFYQYFLYLECFYLYSLTFYYNFGTFNKLLCFHDKIIIGYNVICIKCILRSTRECTLAAHPGDSGDKISQTLYRPAAMYPKSCCRLPAKQLTILTKRSKMVRDAQQRTKKRVHSLVEHSKVILSSSL